MMVKMAKPRRQRMAIAAAKVPQNKGVSQDGLSENIVYSSWRVIGQRKHLDHNR
jgi:hypothetical protein